MRAGDFSRFDFYDEDDPRDLIVFVEWWRSFDSWALDVRKDGEHDLHAFVSKIFPHSTFREYGANHVLDMDDRDKVWFKLAFE